MGVIYLIRHGQASFLKEDYDQLSDLGIDQAKVLGNALRIRNQSFITIGSGTMTRHKQTAKHCLDAFGQTASYHSDKRWNEYDHMDLIARHNPLFTDYSAIGEHLQKQENPMRSLQQILNNSISEWIEGDRAYTQTWPTFKQNCWDVLNEIASKLDSKQNVWVFTSGGPISAILIQLLSLNDEQFVELQGRLVNTGITKVLVGKNKLSLSTYNEYSHLDHNPDLISYR